jgi:hypothetical protein
MNVLKTVTIATVALVGSVGLAFATELAGTYKTEDTKGNAFTITLSEDGTAVGEKHGATLNGTWEDVDGTAVISWTTGWTTMLGKDGDTYKKTVYRAGASLDGEPTSTTGAAKIQ